MALAGGGRAAITSRSVDSNVREFSFALKQTTRPIINDEPAVLCCYHGVQAAELAKLTLEAEGDPCRLAGAQLATTLSLYGSAVAKIELLVQTQDAPRALKILRTQADNDAAERDNAWGTDAQTGWLCAACDEVNHGTSKLWWSCSSVRQSASDLVAFPVEEENLGAND